MTVPFLMYPALMLMVAYLSLYPAVWAGGTVALTRGRCPWLIAAVAPSLWILLEWVRNLGIIGFPWGSLGYSQWASLSFVQFASVTGFWGVSFWIVLVNVALFLTFRAAGRTRLAPAAATALLFLLPFLHGRSVRAGFEASASGQPVVLIQQNTGNDKWNPNRRADVIRNLVNMTLDAAPQSPPEALIIWPETATPTLLLHDPNNYATVRDLSVRIGRPILTGFPDRKLFGNDAGRPRETRYYNAAGLFLPGEAVSEQYAKIKLVPFSEWMPVPGLNRVNFGQSNFTPGDSLRVFEGLVPFHGGNGRKFGVLICYESIFPGMSRKLVREGADFLVNITNDQWFGRSAAPYQHLTMCTFRAIENRVGIARAANTGVTCLIDPTGAIHQATALFEKAVVQGTVATTRGMTFYARYGDWLLLVAGLAQAVAVVLRLRRTARKGRPEDLRPA